MKHRCIHILVLVTFFQIYHFHQVRSKFKKFNKFKIQYGLKDCKIQLIGLPQYRSLSNLIIIPLEDHHP